MYSYEWDSDGTDGPNSLSTTLTKLGPTNVIKKVIVGFQDASDVFGVFQSSLVAQAKLYW